MRHLLPVSVLALVLAGALPARGAEAAAPAGTAGFEARAEKALAKPVDLAWKDAPLEDVLALVAETAGVSVVVDSAVPKAVREQKITFSAKRMTLRSVLGHVLHLASTRQVRLRYALVDEAIVVSEERTLAARLLGGAGPDPVEAEPMTAADALVAVTEFDPWEENIQGSGTLDEFLWWSPFRFPPRPYRDAQGRLHFPGPSSMWVASPDLGHPRFRFTTQPYFLKPEYLWDLYYRPGASAPDVGGGGVTLGLEREALGRLAEIIKRHPEWTTAEILREIERLRAAGR